MFKGSVREKYCAYKEKIVKNDSYRRMLHPYKLRKLQHSTGIVKKSIYFKTNHSDITTIIIDFFLSTHSYIVDIL